MHLHFVNHLQIINNIMPTPKTVICHEKPWRSPKTSHSRHRVNTNRSREKMQPVPKSLRPHILDMNLDNFPDNFYIFSKGLNVGSAENTGIDKVVNKVKKYNKMLKINPECTLYSFRHTGIIKLWGLF